MDPKVREVYQTIAHYSNHDGIAWPSQDRVKAHIRRGKTTVVASIRALEGSGHIQVTQGGKNRANRYQLMRPGTNECFISPRTGSQDQGLVPHRTNLQSGDELLVPVRTNEAPISPLQDSKIEREILGILDRLEYLLSLLPPAARELVLSRTSQWAEDHSLVPVRTNKGVGDHTLVPNPSFEDYQQSQQMGIRPWLDEHWPWVQENSRWQDLGGAEKHYAKFPKDFRRLQARHEATQVVPAEGPEDPEYQVVAEDAENEAEAEAIWQQALSTLDGTVPNATFQTYFMPTVGHSFDREAAVFEVVCPGPLVAATLQRHYHSVARHLAEVTGVTLELAFSIREAG